VDKSQKSRLARELRNGDFLWGVMVVKKNLVDDTPPFVMRQKETYDKLRTKYHLNREDGKSFRGSYADISKQLIDRYGVEHILTKVILPQVTETLINDKTMQYLKACWFNCAWPQAALIEAYNPDNRHAYPFLLWNRQHRFYEGWTAFAHIYWEEIEPYIGSEGV
jgi:hypothetical protein